MRSEERQRRLTILKHGLDNGGGEVHGESIVKSPLEDFTCPDSREEQRVFSPLLETAVPGG